MHERRRHPRWPLHIGVALEHPERQVHLACVSEDISVGGARVLGAAPLLGSVLVVMGTGSRVFATFGDVIQASATDDAGMTEMRVQFATDSEDRTAALGRFLERVRDDAQPEE
jgi:PilZ domain-containing protein